MLKLWFMFDNHTFAQVIGTTRGAILERAKDLFRQDGCGCLFVRDESDSTIEKLTLLSHQLKKGDYRYGVTDDELEAWVDAIMAERSFRSMMLA